METAILTILGILLALRQIVHWFTGRGKKPAQSRAGFSSVIIWFQIYVLLLVLAGYALWTGSIGIFTWVGIGVFGAGIALRCFALIKLGRMYSEAIVVREEHTVIRDGIYAVLRHPLHMALMLEMIGLAFMTANPMWALMLIPALIIYVFRGLQEERLLCEQLGSEYRQYLRSPAWDFLDLLPKRWRKYISENSIETAEK